MVNCCSREDYEQPTGTTLTFDGDGNTTYDQGAALTWDGADHLLSWGSLTSAKYDGFGLRAVRSRYTGYTYTLYDGDTPVCALDSSGNVTSTVTMGPTGLANLHTTASGGAEFIYDPRGNAVATVNASGNVLGTQPALDAFGESGSNVAGPFDYQHTYPTEQFGTGANSLALGFREYDMSMGRFLKRDPLGYGGGINLYGYTQNNPVNDDDPEGLDMMKDKADDSDFARLKLDGYSAPWAAQIVGSHRLAVDADQIETGKQAAWWIAGMLPIDGVVMGALGKAGDVVTDLLGFSGPMRSVKAGKYALTLPYKSPKGAMTWMLLSKGGQDVCRFDWGPLAESKRIPYYLKGKSLPHWHRSIPNPDKPGESLPFQSMKRHRPYERGPGPRY